MKIAIKGPGMPAGGALALVVSERGATGPLAMECDRLSEGALGRAAKAARFKGEKGQILEILSPTGLNLDRLLLIGIGKAGDAKASDLEATAGKLVARLIASGEKSLAISLDGLEVGIDEGDAALALATGAALRAYRFDKYRTKEPKTKKPTLAKTTILAAQDAAQAASRLWKSREAVLSGVFLTRDLVSEPANVLYPESFAARIRELEADGISVEILDEKAMAKLGMNALLGVGQGSSRKPRLVVMRWEGGGKKDKPLAFIGKGVTFDTGGISLKPAEGMDQMKWDMGGAGIVVGLMKALAARKAKANVVGVVGLVENMPSGTAQRPGDIVVSMSGQTIEVLNTDAEGRLVLADALWYTQDRFKPRAMVDLATLTGAIIIALGHEYAGLFSDDDALANRLAEAGEATGEKVWRLPLHEAYDRLIDCPVADMKNIGPGRAAGSITAAQFLKRFTNGVPWAHIDVAGVVWDDKDGDLHEKGATGFGVRLLDRLVAAHFER